jgi:hypothetical protein
MRQLVLAWLILVSLAFALAGSCAIDHRSGAFECAKTADCEAPRVCSDGLCILPAGTVDARPGDAPNDAIDAAACPPQCTSCDVSKKQCVIDCASGADCNGPVTCPTGWSCDIKCNTPDACRSGINCQMSEGCDIQCTGSRACRNVTCGGGPCTLNCQARESCNGVTCGTDRCNVTCNGIGSCNSVKCGQACACDVKCADGACVSNNITCTAPQCVSGRGCSSAPLFCDSCP